jgi:hypothetical protein
VRIKKEQNMLLTEKIKIEKLQKVRKMKNKGKRNGEKTEKGLGKEYLKRMCVEQTGEEQIKLEDANYDNNKDYEQKPRISPCGFFWYGNPNLSLDLDKSSDSEDEAEEKAKFRNKKLGATDRRDQERQEGRHNSPSRRSTNQYPVIEFRGSVRQISFS